MFTDIQYLKLWVGDEPWEAIIRQLYGRKLSKKEVQRRIAFTVVSADKGKVQTGKGDMWLQACDSFPQYQVEGNWEEEYAAIKETDKAIIDIRKKLATIEYLKPELVPKDGVTFGAHHYLVEDWDISSVEAAEEVSLYGCIIIEKFQAIQPAYFGRRKKGRYHFVRALHKFAQEQGYNLVVYKESEEKRLFND